MRFSVCVAVVCLALLMVSAGARADCPECYHDRPRPTGNGAGVTSDGRVRLQIYVDGAGMTSAQQEAAWGALDWAAEMWNTTTANGERTDYLIQPTLLNQHQATFVVRIGQPGGAGCAEIDTTVIPHVITVSATLLGRTVQDRGAMIAHEIGHRLGLAEARQGGTCGTSASIMRGGTTSCEAVSRSVTSSDVSQVRRGDYQQHTCTQSQPQKAVVELDNTCFDADGDGWSICDESPDCNDADPNFTDNCSGCGDDEAPRAYDCYASGGVWRTAPDCLCDYPYVGPQPGGSPILLDITGDGFALTDAAGGVFFDLDADGARERLSWTPGAADDVWLALDRDGSGSIESGRELFGDFTPQPPSPEPNGFLALAEYDRPEHGGNADGMIDGRDQVFSSLRLWRDANHDGVSQPWELHALPSLDVARLYLDYKRSKRVDQHGNEFRYRAKVDDAKGAKVNRWAWDVFLVLGQ